MFDIENLVVKNKDMTFNLWKNAIIKSKYRKIIDLLLNMKEDAE